MLSDPPRGANAGAFRGLRPGISTLVIAALGLLYLALMPDAPHGDGLRFAQSVERGVFDFNPNYLLLQPLALTGFRLARHVGFPPDALRFQKLLDVAAALATLGVLAAMLRTLGTSRALRATLLVLIGLSFNFGYLATSDHIKLVTAPFLALTLYAMARYCLSPRIGWLVLGGLMASASALTLVTAALWAVALTMLVIAITPGGVARRLGAATVFALAAAVPSAIAFVVVHASVAPGVGFMPWMLGYGRLGTTPAFTPPTLVTIARAGFALVKNLAFSSSVGPSGKVLLGVPAFSRATVTIGLNLLATIVAALLISAVALRLVTRWRGLAAPDRALAGLALSILLAFGAFALVWNSAEEEFWFQTTFGVALALVVVARAARFRPTLTVAVAIATAIIAINNVVSFELPRKRFPYRHIVVEVTRVARPGDAFVVSGGETDVGILYGVNRSKPVQVTAIDQMLERYGYRVAPTVRAISARIDSTVAAGGGVVLMDALNPDPQDPPWFWLAEQYRIGPEPFVRMLREKGAYRLEPVPETHLWRLMRRMPPGRRS